MDRRNGILDPLAHQRVSVLTDREVVSPGQDESLWRVEASLVEDSVDGNNQKISESSQERAIGVELEGFSRRRHLGDGVSGASRKSNMASLRHRGVLYMIRE